MSYHSGELEVQERAGVESPRIGVRDRVPAAAAQFLAAQPIAIASTMDAGGRVWASLLAGEPGFARAVDERTIAITPAAGNEVFEGDAGLLVIEFATRRRMRINGRLRRTDPGPTFLLETREAYANCPQYITPQPVAIPCLGDATSAGVLDDPQRDFIRGANTFFIATRHPGAGADASHRGGPAGFVEVAGDRIRWLDFPGNNMFNTLGNLAVDSRCGLLFTDFRRTLQVTGRATIAWDGTARAVDLRVEGVLYHAPCIAPPV